MGHGNSRFTLCSSIQFFDPNRSISACEGLNMSYQEIADQYFMIFTIKTPFGQSKEHHDFAQPWDAPADSLASHGQISSFFNLLFFARAHLQKEKYAKIQNTRTSRRLDWNSTLILPCTQRNAGCLWKTRHIEICINHQRMFSRVAIRTTAPGRVSNNQCWWNGVEIIDTKKSRSMGGPHKNVNKVITKVSGWNRKN